VAKQAKLKIKRTQVKDLQVEQQELTADNANKVKGGSAVLAHELTHTVQQGLSDPDRPIILGSLYNPKDKK
jgi:hypothetical protein